MFQKKKEHTVSEWTNDHPKDLVPGCLDIWRIHIPSVPVGEIEFLLSAQEKSRTEKYKFDKDRSSYAVSRSALRLILGKYLKENPQKLNFSYNSYGKPALDSLLKRKNYFNVSHSGEFALIAIGPDAEMGIDIELMRELDYLGLAEHFFSFREQTEIRRLPSDFLKKGFYTVWTRKEAFIKAIGMGLSFPLKEFDVSINLREIPQIRIHKSQSVFDTGWEIHDIVTENQYCAALVIPGNKFTKIRAFNFNLKQFEYIRAI